jgi:peptidyl-prolyl cis-trans isomerase C
MPLPIKLISLGMWAMKKLVIHWQCFCKPHRAKAIFLAGILSLIFSQSTVIAQKLPIKEAQVNIISSQSLEAQKPQSAEKSIDNAYEFISKALLELTVQEWIAQGHKDTPKLRKDLKEELINRELIAQEVVRLGLDRQTNMDDQWLQLKHRMYVQIFADAFLKDQGFTEESLKQDYQNQKIQGGQNLAVAQYQLKQIRVREKSAALAVLGRIEQGESFDLIANQLGLASGIKSNKNNAVWVNANQLPPVLSEALSNLSMGGVHVSPVATEGGWLILKLEDKRNGENGGNGPLMSYEEYKNQKVQAALRQYYNDTLRRLRSVAKINQ